VIASPLRPRPRQEPGIAAAGQLAHRGTPYGASLSFATTTHPWPLSDPPSRKPRSAQPSRTGIARSIPGRALASSVSGSPCQGPGTGLPPPISTSVPGTPTAPSPCGLRLRDDRAGRHGSHTTPSAGLYTTGETGSRTFATQRRPESRRRAHLLTKHEITCRTRAPPGRRSATHPSPNRRRQGS